MCGPYQSAHMAGAEALSLESDIADFLARCGCEHWTPVLQRAKVNNVGYFVEVPCHELEELLSGNNIEVLLGERVAIRRLLKVIAPSMGNWGEATVPISAHATPNVSATGVTKSTGKPKKSTKGLWSQSEGADLDHQDLLGPLVNGFASVLSTGARLCQPRVSAICYGVWLKQGLNVDLMPDPWHYDALAEGLKQLFPIQLDRDVRGLCNSTLDPRDNPWIQKLKNFLENWRKGDYPHIAWPDYQQWKSHLVAVRLPSAAADKLRDDAVYFDPAKVVDLFLLRSKTGDIRLYTLKLKEIVTSTIWMLRTSMHLGSRAATKHPLAPSIIPPAQMDNRTAAELLTQAELLQKQQDKQRSSAKQKKKLDDQEQEEAGRYAISTDDGSFVMYDQALRKVASTLDVAVGNFLYDWLMYLPTIVFACRRFARVPQAW